MNKNKNNRPYVDIMILKKEVDGKTNIIINTTQTDEEGTSHRVMGSISEEKAKELCEIFQKKEGGDFNIRR